jgi:large repetitive protein
MNRTRHPVRTLVRILSKLLVLSFLATIAILAVESLAGAHFTSQGAGAGSAQTASASLEKITIAPTSATVVAGQTVTYTVTAFDDFNGSTTVTTSAVLSITNGSCSTSTNSCLSSTVGAQTVTATYEGKTATATQNVIQASTTTAVASTTGTPSVVGESVTYAATVSVTAPGAGTPTGNVEFFDGGVSIGTCSPPSGSALSGSTATCTVLYTAPGLHIITAQYLGDSNFLESPVSPPITQVVNQAGTSTALSTNLSAYVSGQDIVVTAIVSPVAPGTGTPTGTVLVSDGGSPANVCTITLPNTTCTIVETTPGTYTLTGTYSGDANFLGSSGSATAVVVSADGSSTVVSDNASNPVTGDSFTFSATVSAVTPGSGTPQGTITWTVSDPYGDPVSCPDTTLSAGVATCTITNAMPGTYSASAVFNDTEGNFTTSTSNTDTVDVGTSSTSPTKIVQCAPFGHTVTTTTSSGFSDQLGPISENGTPVMFVTVVTNGSLSVSKGGQVTTSGYLKVGTYTVSGTDTDTTGGSGTWTYTLTVIPVTIVQTPPFSNTVSMAHSSGFTTQLGPISENINPVMFVTVVTNANLLVTGTGAVAVTGGPLKFGTYTVSGTDSDGLGDVGTWTYTLTVAAGTITQIPPFGATASVSQSASFFSQLEVTGSTGSTVYTVEVSTPDLKVSSSGAITTTGTLAPGTYSVSGSDADGSNDAGTWSFTLTVTEPSSGSTVVRLLPPLPLPVIVGSEMTYWALVVPVLGSGPLSGTVDFFENGVPVVDCQNVSLTLDVAPCVLTFPAAGVVVVSATYGNDPNYVGSSDSAIQLVLKGTTALTISPGSPVPAGTTVTYRATITETSGSGPLTGTVTFSENGAGLVGCSALALTGDSVTCTVHLTSTGTVVISAVYTGDPNFLGSTGSINQLVTGNLVIITNSLAGANAGETNYSQTLQGTGGTPPYTWSISAGVLPEGLTLNSSTGVVSGNVSTSATTETFTVTLRDADGASTTKQFTLTVNRRPVFTCGHSGHGQSGHLFWFQFTAWGGPQPRFNVTGQLPPWLHFDAATGIISGTPGGGDTGSYSFTVTASNAWGAQSQTFSLDVTD